MPVRIQLEREGPQGEEAEVDIQHQDVDEAGHLPVDRRAQEQQPQHADDERHPLELGEVLGGEVVHADVVVEEVDLLDVLPAVAPDELVVVDVEPQPLRVLRREHRQVPQREEERHDEQAAATTRTNLGASPRGLSRNGCSARTHALIGVLRRMRLRRHDASAFTGRAPQAGAPAPAARFGLQPDSEAVLCTPQSDPTSLLTIR